MIQTTAELESIERFDQETARLTLLDSSGLAQQVEPGQFLNVRVRDLMDPLFGGPFRYLTSRAQPGNLGEFKSYSRSSVEGHLSCTVCNPATNWT